MTADIIHLPRTIDEPDAESNHWLLFGPEHTDPHIVSRPVVGCACGFRADLEADGGYGDSVVDHLLEVGKATA